MHYSLSMITSSKLMVMDNRVAPAGDLCGACKEIVCVVDIN